MSLESRNVKLALRQVRQWSLGEIANWQFVWFYIFSFTLPPIILDWRPGSHARRIVYIYVYGNEKRFLLETILVKGRGDDGFT